MVDYLVRCSDRLALIATANYQTNGFGSRSTYRTCWVIFHCLTKRMKGFLAAGSAQASGGTGTHVS